MINNSFKKYQLESKNQKNRKNREFMKKKKQNNKKISKRFNQKYS